MPPLDLDFKQGIKNCVESTKQPGSHKEKTKVHTHNTLHVSSRDTWHVSSLLTQQAKPGNGSGAPGFHYKGH